MKRTDALIALFLAISCAGCVASGKQPVAKAPPAPKPTVAAAPPPPRQLSIPQTTVELPTFQPLTTEAIESAQPAEETPAAPPPPKPPAASRRTNQPAQPPREVTPQGPATPAPVTPAPAPPPDREPIQEALSPGEQKRLLDEADTYRKETQTRITQAQAARLSAQQRSLITRIRTFLKQSDDAQRRNDIRQASELAQRAVILARGLQP